MGPAVAVQAGLRVGRGSCAVVPAITEVSYGHVALPVVD